MREQVFAMSLAVLFTLINSCSDNKREKRLDRNLYKTIENVQKTYGTITRNQKSLELSINNIEKIKKIINHSNHFPAWPVCDTLNCNHNRIFERHNKLNQKAILLMESLTKLQGENESEVLRLQVRSIELLRESNKLIKIFKEYHKLNDTQLIVASKVDHGIMGINH